MKRKELNILIVEDDRSTAKVLAEAFKRAGFEPQISTHPKDAIGKFRAQHFDLVIMDCMLPGMNGVELSEKLQKLTHEKFHLILTSGVFKSPSFARDAKSRTNCEHFFNKPFDLENFLDKCVSLFEDELEEDTDPFFDLITEPEISQEKVLSAIEQTETIQGSDLPLVYSYLQKSRVAGTLHLKSKNGVQSSIDFFNGEISNVNVPDRKSYFGILLIENGFTSAADIEEHLAQKNDKPIGLRLVESHTISPHSIKIVLKQQMSLRLSKTIQDDSYEFSFTPTKEGEKPDHSVTEPELAHLCNDWVDSKMNRDSLLRFYIPWMEYKVEFNDSHSRFNSMKDLPILRVAPKIFKHLENHKSLHELMALSGVNDEEFLSVIHFLVLQKLIVFGKNDSKQKSQKHRLRYLKSMAEGIESKDHFQILGLNQEARESEIEKAYLDMAKIIHPDKLEHSAGKELVGLTNKVFSKVNEAYEVLKNADSRSKYLKKLHNGDAESVLAAESKINEGETLLKRGEYTKAYQIFKEIYKMKSYRADVPLLLAWALLKAPTNKDKAEKIQKTAQTLLKKIPPEERHQPRYFLVKGLFYAFVGYHDKAVKNFKNAYTADPTLIEARREMIRSHKSRKPQMMESQTLITKILKKMG